VKEHYDEAARISRREAICRGLTGAATLAVGGHLGSEALAAMHAPAGKRGATAGKRAAPAAKHAATDAKAKSVIQIFLWGGMSHNDTWDPKPESGREYMGELSGTVETNVSGIRLGGLFPLLAKQADKFSLIRSMTHRNFGHETAAYLMQTGHAPGERISYPSVGAIFALAKSETYDGLIPPYVVLTSPQGRFSEEGFLGPKYKPFATGGDPNSPRFEVEGIVARGITDDRQRGRRHLLTELDSLGHALKFNEQIIDTQEAKDAAYELILGKGKDVFDLAKEKPELRERYGKNTFGQECLVARRLVEEGVPYIVINYPAGWDTHKDHFPTMRRQCPQLDQGLAMLLQDLQDHGLLESTLVWCTGEFGRGPKVDWQPPWNGGRNHYGNVFSVLVAGGGFKGGQVVGSSDAKAEEVKDRPVYPVDLLGSIYKLAGIDAKAKLPHPMGLDAFVLPGAAENVKSAGLLTEIM
jgi:hypothetical protein